MGAVPAIYAVPAVCVDALPLCQLLMKMVQVVDEMLWILLTVPDSRGWHFECCCYYLLLPTLRSHFAFVAHADGNNTAACECC